MKIDGRGLIEHLSDGFDFPSTTLGMCDQGGSAGSGVHMSVSDYIGE